MTVQKIAVSLPKELVTRARRIVGKTGNLSAYLSKALEDRIKSDDLRGLIDEMLAETGGPLSEEEKRWAQAALSGRPAKWPSKQAAKRRRAA